MTILIRDVDA